MDAEPLTAESIAYLRIDLAGTTETRRLFDAARVLATIDAKDAEIARLTEDANLAMQGGSAMTQRALAAEADRDAYKDALEAIMGQHDHYVVGRPCYQRFDNPSMWCPSCVVRVALARGL